MTRWVDWDAYRVNVKNHGRLQRAERMERAGAEQSARADQNQKDMLEWRGRAEEENAELEKLRIQFDMIAFTNIELQAEVERLKVHDAH